MKKSLIGLVIGLTISGSALADHAKSFTFNGHEYTLTLDNYGDGFSFYRSMAGGMRYIKVDDNGNLVWYANMASTPHPLEKEIADQIGPSFGITSKPTSVPQSPKKVVQRIQTILPPPTETQEEHDKLEAKYQNKIALKELNSKPMVVEEHKGVPQVTITIRNDSSAKRQHQSDMEGERMQSAMRLLTLKRYGDTTPIGKGKGDYTPDPNKKGVADQGTVVDLTHDTSAKRQRVQEIKDAKAKASIPMTDLTPSIQPPTTDTTEPTTPPTTDEVVTAVNNNADVLDQTNQNVSDLTNQVNNNSEQMNQGYYEFQQRMDSIDNRDAKQDKTISANRKIAAGGIASVAAMASIPEAPVGQSFSFGIGTGGFDGASALAAGLSVRASEHTNFKVNVGTASGSGATYGAGVGMSW